MSPTELFDHIIKCMESSGHDHFLQYWARQSFDLAFSTFTDDTVLICRDYSATVTAPPPNTITAHIPWHLYQEVVMISVNPRDVQLHTAAGTITVRTMDTTCMHVFSAQNSQHILSADYLSSTVGGIAAMQHVEGTAPGTNERGEAHSSA